MPPIMVQTNKSKTSIMAETTLTFAVAVTIGLLLAGDSSARELRPSDHGLIFQTLSPTGSKSSPDMRSFFNSENSAPTSTSSSDVAIPRAMNSGAAPPSWLREAAARPNGGERAGKALMAASVVCGIAGAVLLVASGLLYLLKYRTKKHKRNTAFGGGDDDGNNGETENDDDHDKKLQLVVRNP